MLSGLVPGSYVAWLTYNNSPSDWTWTSIRCASPSQVSTIECASTCISPSVTLEGDGRRGITGIVRVDLAMGIITDKRLGNDTSE